MNLERIALLKSIDIKRWSRAQSGASPQAGFSRFLADGFHFSRTPYSPIAKGWQVVWNTKQVRLKPPMYCSKRSRLKVNLKVTIRAVSFAAPYLLLNPQEADIRFATKQPIFEREFQHFADVFIPAKESSSHFRFGTEGSLVVNKWRDWTPDCHRGAGTIDA